MNEKIELTAMVRKRGSKWCVLHGHPQKPGSKTDKPVGSVIKCFPFKEGDKASEARAKKKAEAMHQAIIISQQNE